MAQSPLSPTEHVLRSADVDELAQQVTDENESKAEAKKRRHRENMARGRSRHNALMDSMRKQYQNLHKKLETGMVAWRMRRATNNSSQSEQNPPSKELMAQYIDAVETENAIHRENEALAQRLEQMAIFETTLRVDTPEVADPNLHTERPRTVQALNRPGFWSYFAEDTEPFYYEPMPAATCYNLIREKYQTIKSHHFMFMRKQLSEVPVQFFGWTVQRYLSERRKLEFHFMKQIPCTDSEMLAEELAIEGWKVFNDPEMYRRCYRSAIDVRVLQRVDAFNTILMRNSPDATRSHRIRHLNISSKVSDEDESGKF
ncbi:hypothetical protein PPTG_03806 [Phytophthora nicotianae INRA-310]|uniref:Uncharacterized protein n=1 Tax=Phytophthora nicotianae (strain INRA-310) TaxID=761204 RepID=W2R0R0_PHYN3|nr:hypothetical protein PPTG_03806 [Phytophthora nicotianae INRA-310]ETN18100.1 hypothetical protein PPTG_03806 [Phytophthora nicotianae INRA-310]